MKVALTNHALERYHERVKPALSYEAAEREVMALIASCEITDYCPEWLLGGVGHDEVVAYAVPCEGVAFPLAHDGTLYVALTCRTQGTLAPELRAHRNSQARKRRFARMAHRRKWHDRAKV